MPFPILDLYFVLYINYHGHKKFNDTDMNQYNLPGDDIYFAIDEITGDIKTTQILDYETAEKTTFILNVKVKDTAEHTATQTITINLRNINDNQPIFTRPLPDGSITKDIPETIGTGTSIYGLEARDADGDTITYSLLGQEPAVPALFILTGTTVRTDGKLDFENGLTSVRLTFR